MKNILLPILALSLTFPVIAQRNKISEKEVSRILRTLSADDMQGRHVFTPGITRASDFIQKEFKKAGLKPLPGMSTFSQKFSVYETKPGPFLATLNGQQLEADAGFAISGSDQVHWKAADAQKPEVIRIGEQANFMQVARPLFNASKNQLVLVHPSHAATFKRAKTNFTRPGMRTGKSNAATVFILTDQTDAGQYDITFRQEIKEQALNNVVGYLPGKSRSEEFVLFSAHYDHIGILKAVEGDSIANGADDDASGTTAVIALARHFKKQKKNERSLIFVAFTAEEVGGYGSQYFSKQLDPNKVVAMFNIEMIGKESKFGRNAGFITGFERSDFGKIVQKNLEGSGYQFHPDPYTQENLFYRSDNATLARLGVPAHSLSTDKIDVDPLYHSVNDEFESLDLGHMTATIRAIATAAKSIIAGKDTPTRLAPEPGR